MSGVKGQQRVDHLHAATQARQLAGQWVLAGTYGSRASAVTATFAVRTGRMPAYQPAGTFEARPELTEDGADLWVRYVAPQAVAAPSARDFRESIEAELTESFEAFSRRLDAANHTARRP